MKTDSVERKIFVHFHLILMGIGNFHKLSLLPEVERNLFCILSVDFGFREFQSFRSNWMVKGNLTNIAVTYLRVQGDQKNHRHQM